jgi:secreted PhoX family phosphatase
MASFAGPGGVTILVRNHELSVRGGPAVDPKRVRRYDAMAPGGTTTLWVDGERRLVKSYASVSGTLRNCAGGATPWGSWLTAEEDTTMPGKSDGRNADLSTDVAQRHGYIFEVDAMSSGLVEPVPLRAMGRFRHEAVAVDPVTGFAYLTEDRDDSLLYRFRPAALADGASPSSLRVGDYAKGGVLEALRVRTRPQLLTDNRTAGRTMKLNEELDVEWVRIEDADPDVDMEYHGKDRDVRTAAGSTRGQGFANGCASFSRTEGIAYAEGSVYFCCTNGGPKEYGQVFRIRLREQKLSLVVESTDYKLLDGPDNLCVAPWGDLIICEDSSDSHETRVVGVTPQGRCFPIARNAHPMNQEIAGACFAADGNTLFFNVQQPGMTFAVWGPWSSRRA